MNASKEPWMLHSFLISSLIWQKMDLCTEQVWSSPSNGLQYSKIEEIDNIYDFRAGLNPMFDVVRGCILG